MERILQVRDLGLTRYGEALAVQEQLVQDRKANRVPDTLVLVEHEPVYTLGRSAEESHILSSERELQQAGVEVVPTNRGGDVTYHGPGQLVGYPIIDLAARKKGVLWYVNHLEAVLIRVLRGYGIEGSRNSANRGVWVGEDKIAAIGVRITRQVTMHGFALNVRTDLRYYEGIVPCGLSDKGVLSMHLLNPDVAFDDVKECVVRHFTEMFGYAVPREGTR